MRRFELGHEPPEDLRRTTTPEERWEMTWRLSVEAWLLAGRELPTYARHETPCRILRDDDPRYLDE